MRKFNHYKKIQGSSKQQRNLAALNKLQDDIAKYFFDTKYKNKS